MQYPVQPGARVQASEPESKLWNRSPSFGAEVSVADSLHHAAGLERVVEEVVVVRRVLVRDGLDHLVRVRMVRMLMVLMVVMVIPS